MRSVKGGGLLMYLVCIGLTFSCVPRSDYEELAEVNHQLEAELNKQRKSNALLTQYVDSIVPLLTLNQPARLRDAVFPTVVRFTQSMDRSLDQEQEYIPSVTEEDQELIGLLRGDMATLTEAGEIQEISVENTSTLQNVQRELTRSQDFLWRISGDRYTMILPQDKFFQRGKSGLQTSGQRLLLRLAQRFKYLSGYDILIETHTDDQEASRTSGGQGSWELTARRAANIAAFLEQQGVSSEHLLAAGRGHFDPYFLPSSESNRTHNRRIEIILMPKTKN
ncbi:MAG: OmpA family protein [Bacteroidota bacterium]